MDITKKKDEDQFSSIYYIFIMENIGRLKKWNFLKRVIYEPGAAELLAPSTKLATPAVNATIYNSVCRPMRSCTT